MKDSTIDVYSAKVVPQVNLIVRIRKLTGPNHDQNWIATLENKMFL